MTKSRAQVSGYLLTRHMIFNCILLKNVVFYTINGKDGVVYLTFDNVCVSPLVDGPYFKKSTWPREYIVLVCTTKIKSGKWLLIRVVGRWLKDGYQLFNLSG